MTEDEALAQYDAELYQLHASRGDSWGGGDAAGLDYYPVEKGAIEGNVMPDEVRALVPQRAPPSSTPTATCAWWRAAASTPSWWTS